jgi:hypothetical protein
VPHRVVGPATTVVALGWAKCEACHDLFGLASTVGQ